MSPLRMLPTLLAAVGLPAHVSVPDVEAHHLDADVVHVLLELVREVADVRALFEVGAYTFSCFALPCCCSRLPADLANGRTGNWSGWRIPRATASGSPSPGSSCIACWASFRACTSLACKRFFKVACSAMSDCFEPASANSGSFSGLADSHQARPPPPELPPQLPLAPPLLLLPPCWLPCAAPGRLQHFSDLCGFRHHSQL